MKAPRKIIEIDEERCDGCGQCVPSCAEGALQVVDGKARLIGEGYCDGLGACLEECPLGALRIVERMAEDFDEDAVDQHLRARGNAGDSPVIPGHSCPSTRMESRASSGPTGDMGAHSGQEQDRSALSHWPVQIRLVPPTAPFLKGSDLLVLADCAPVAYPNLHQDLLGGKTVMMGCPKFDDPSAYIDKFAEVFKAADIRSITIAVMEVPCCQGLQMIVKKGMEIARMRIPVEQVVISTRGDLLARKAL
jgi:Fe-S-cluster-containing hydrogenase component 2